MAVDFKLIEIQKESLNFLEKNIPFLELDGEKSKELKRLLKGVHDILSKAIVFD